MKTMVVYDSYYGNTARVAEEIAQALSTSAIKVGTDEIEDSYDALVIGCPTRAFRPTPPIMAFIRQADLAGKPVMVFDTRILKGDTSNGFLRVMISLFGYAAEKMGKAVMRHGGILVGLPEGFAVEDTEGPLKNGELERAVEWAGGLR